MVQVREKNRTYSHIIFEICLWQSWHSIKKSCYNILSIHKRKRKEKKMFFFCYPSKKFLFFHMEKSNIKSPLKNQYLQLLTYEFTGKDLP